MEEKLYFKPANYGEGQKQSYAKHKQNKAGLKGNRNSKIRLLCTLFVMAIIIVILIWLLRGKTTVIGQYPENIRNESLSCSSTGIIYKKTNEVDSEDKELRIDMVFDNDEELNSISLKYILRFDSIAEARAATLNSQAQFNIGLQTIGYTAEKFNNKFTQLDNTLIITLNISAKNSLTEIARSYFLIEGTDEKNLPITLSDYRANYELQGFSCISSIEKNNL